MNEPRDEQPAVGPPRTARPQQQPAGAPPPSGRANGAPGAADHEPGDSGAGDHGSADHGAGGSAAEAPAAPAAWRLVVTLAGAGALAGLLLVLVHEATAPAIAAHREARLRQAVEQVLQQPARTELLYLVDGVLRATLPPGLQLADVERLWAGFDGQGRRIGYAIAAERPGYQDVVRLLFGYDPQRDVLLGMTVLASRETPGLGDSIEKDSHFIEQFAGVTPPLLGVKAGAAKDSHSVDTITGATISSRTVISAINEALARVCPALTRGAADDDAEDSR